MTRYEGLDRGEATIAARSHRIAGVNTFTFTGRIIGGHVLGPGSYRLIATPTAGGQPGVPISVPFKIVS